MVAYGPGIVRMIVKNRTLSLSKHLGHDSKHRVNILINGAQIKSISNDICDADFAFPWGEFYNIHVILYMKWYKI